MLLKDKMNEERTKKVELREGTKGNGDSCFVVQTTYLNGRTWQEMFDTKHEAETWYNAIN